MINPKIQRQTAFWEKRSPALFLKSYIQTVIYFAVFSMVKVSSIASTLPSSVI